MAQFNWTLTKEEFDAAFEKGTGDFALSKRLMQVYRELCGFGQLVDDDILSDQLSEIGGHLLTVYTKLVDLEGDCGGMQADIERLHKEVNARKMHPIKNWLDGIGL